MIETILTTAMSGFGYDLLKKLFKNNRSKLQRSFGLALDAAKDWYVSEYDDQYGTENNRFFDYQVVEDELEKLVFYLPEPSIEVIEHFAKNQKIKVPTDVLQAFLGRLKNEMEKIPECDAVLAERAQLIQIHRISDQTANTATNTAELVKIQKEQLNVLKESLQPTCPVENNGHYELDWKKLFDAFKRRQLDKIMIKQIGEGKDGLEILELSGTFFEQDVSTRSIDISSLPIEDDQQQKAVHQFMQQAAIWQSYLWRYLQEHRLQVRITNLQEDEGAATRFIQITDKLNLRATGKPGRLTGHQFAQVLEQIAQDLEMTTSQIAQTLSWYFDASMKREPVLSALKTPCSALLIGDAGSGKTTAMRKMCLDLYEALVVDNSSARPVPIFVRLDTIYEYLSPGLSIEDSADVLIQYMCDHWQEDLVQKNDLCKSVLEQSPRPIQLVLDGLDEVGSVKVRQKLAKAVRHLSQDSNFHIIVTSRPAALDQSLLALFQLSDYRLMDLTDRQTPAFVEQFFKIYNGDDKATGLQDAAAFNSALADTDAAQEFGANPLYLTIMMLMHKKHEVLPQRRIELYQEFINMLLSQRQSEPVHGKVGVKPVFRVSVPGRPPVQWGDTTYRKLLYRIAFDTHGDEKDSVSITEQRVVDAIKATRLMGQVKEKNEQDLAREFIDFCDERLGLLVSRGPYYGFSHRSIQEYFAAGRLSGLEKEEIFQFWHNKALNRPDRWHEVVRLLFCLIRVKDYCFEYLELQWPKDIQAAGSPQTIEMIAAALFDLQGFHPNYDGEIYDLYEKVKQALIHRRNDCAKNPRLFVACGDALGLLNEPAIEIGKPPVVELSAAQPFMMGDNQGEKTVVHPVKLSKFWMDKYPVTNKQFAEFVQKGGYDDPDNWVDPQGRFAFDGRKYLEKHKWAAPAYWRDERVGKKRILAPVVGVSWFEAMAFCRWWTKNYGQAWARARGLDQEITARLPTEAEWEFAARGYDGNEYPWGKEDPGKKTLHANLDYEYRQTTTVGSFPNGAASGTGLMDMAGNVWEWCFDVFDDQYYKNSLEQDPVNIAKGQYRVLRGGSWSYDRDYARCAYRFRFNPYFRFNNVGFRCVRT